MKKLNLLVAISLLFLWSGSKVLAKSVPADAAKNVGYNYLTLHGMETLAHGAADLNLVYISGGATPYFYVFSGSNCFVIVSAEDAVTPVIGYSKERPFHGDKIPSTVTGFFENYNKQIDYVIKNKVAASPEIATSWNNLALNRPDGTKAKTTAVSPLLTTTWDQSPYYNASCPIDASAPAGSGGRCPTGCVATATAQVMKFWGWPATGVGSHAYVSSYGTLSANFGATTYNWSAMPNNVASSNPSVATLMSHIGISVEMQYTPTESGSYVISAATGTPPYCAEYSLRTFFNYDPTLHGEFRSDYTDATWIGMLKTDLNAGRPIIYYGVGTAGGHAFVFDGYDASNNMHVNWGWGGFGPDGYYDIDALNPPALGTGGGGGGFNDDQGAILGVKPPVTLTPDTFEVNNTATTAYNLSPTLTWASNIAHTGTPAANFHNSTDGDYYKLVLPGGYRYTITARINDMVSKDDAIPYSVDAVWSYSKDGGLTWSPVYDNVMSGTINLATGTGGTVTFRCTPKTAGSTGTYLLKIANITRVSTVELPNVELSEARIYPNPTADFLTVDLSGTGCTNAVVSLTNIIGKRVYTAEMNQQMLTIPVNTLASGMYVLEVSSANGTINRKISIGK